MVSGDVAIAAAMAVCHYLPRLSLDRPIPNHVLQRRGAISFSSSSSLFKSLPRLERRGGISFDRTDKAAIYVRMLGDVRVKSKQLMSHTDGRRGSLPDNEYKIIEAIDNNVRRTSLKHTRAWSLPRGCAPISTTKPRRRRPPESTLMLDSGYCGQANQLLNKLSCWDFNIFHMEQVTGGHSLRFLGMQIFQKYDLIHKFQLDPTNLYKCLVAIETGYHNGNPYHNALHAADVTQAMYCYLQEHKLRENLTPIEVMSAILASATHDLDHPGVNQVFLIATSNHLAELYGNSSVLENHHWRAAISVLRESRLLDHLDKKNWDYIVHQISSLILATDIGRQQEFLQNFKNHLNANDFDLSDQSHKSFILQIALKCADICNPCRKWELSRRWSEMVTEEFYNQGDRERGLKLPLTMNCDRYKNTIQQIQAGFMKFVVEPLFTEWSRFMPTRLSIKMLDNISKNKASWEAYGEQEKAAAENDRKQLSNQKVTNRLRKVDGQSGVIEQTEKKALKEAQLNNNNNATTTGLAKVTAASEASVGRAKDPSLDLQLSSAMDLETRPMEVDSTSPSCATAGSVGDDGSPRGNVTQGRTAEQTVVQVPHNLNNPAGDVAADRQEQLERTRVPSASKHRRPRPVSVGEISLTREGRHLETRSRMHSNPASPMIPRTLVAGQFSLRLHRSSEPASKKPPASFEDPWLVRHADPNRTSPGVSTRHRSPGQEFRASESSAMSKDASPNRSATFRADREGQRTFSRERSYELNAGMNNNLNVRNQVRSPRLETTTVVGGHTLHSVPSPSNRSSTYSRFSAASSSSSTGSKYNHSSSQAAQDRSRVSSDHHPHGMSPRVTRHHLEAAPRREPGRGQRSLAEMGSPWIRKKMEERDQRRYMSKSSSIPPSLSPRPPPRTLRQASSNWYSVPPALGPVIQDFASSQLASIAQHKKQSQELLAKTPAQPSPKGDVR